MTVSPSSATFLLAANILTRPSRILILSPCENLREIFLALHGHEVVYSRSVNLSAALLEQIAPDVIVAPVLGQDHDILDIAQSLRDLGFRGTLCGINHPYLHAPLVKAEVRAQCPQLRFQLIERPF